MQPDKFYIVVRKDLGSHGYQAAQASHAAIDYCMTYRPAEWWTNSNTIVTLTVNSEKELFDLAQLALKNGVKHTIFCEPHLGYEATSLALEPGDKAKTMCKGLPLLGKELSDWVKNDLRFSLVELQDNNNQNNQQTLMQHGYDVNRHVMDLLQFLSTGEKGMYDWNLPEIVTIFSKEILDKTHHISKIWDYTLFHDCGKPLCKQIVDGQYQFPGHAKMSAKVAKRKGLDEHTCFLIEHDMDLHTMKADEVTDFVTSMYKEDICVLLVVAFAEIMANSKFGGGVESESYKIKHKRLSSRAKIILPHLFGSKNKLDF